MKSHKIFLSVHIQGSDLCSMRGKQTGPERVKWGRRRVSKKSIFTRIALQMKIVTVVQIFAHARSHTNKLERKVTCRCRCSEEQPSSSPSPRQIPIVAVIRKRVPANKERGQAYYDTLASIAAEKYDHKDTHFFFYPIDSFRKRHLASLPWSVQGQLDQQLLPILDAWFTSVLGAPHDLYVIPWN